MSITHQGAGHIERHTERKSHQQRVKSARNQSRLMFTASSSDSSGGGNEVTAAEVRNTMMIAHHNAALCLADHIGPMQRKNFPDSKIAQNYRCARTKTACILNYAIAPLLRDELVAQMKAQMILFLAIYKWIKEWVLCNWEI